MGYYINSNSKGETLPNKGKVKALVQDGARTIAQGAHFTRLTWHPDIVVVVENTVFDAAAYAYDQDELDDFLIRDTSNRMKTILEYKHAKELSGYKET